MRITFRIQMIVDAIRNLLNQRCKFFGVLPSLAGKHSNVLHQGLHTIVGKRAETRQNHAAGGMRPLKCRRADIGPGHVFR